MGDWSKWKEEQIEAIITCLLFHITYMYLSIFLVLSLFIFNMLISSSIFQDGTLQNIKHAYPVFLEVAAIYVWKSNSSIILKLLNIIALRKIFCLAFSVQKTIFSILAVLMDFQFKSAICWMILVVYSLSNDSNLIQIYIELSITPSK